MKKTPYWTIALVIFCTIFTSFGQYFIKHGANRINDLYSVLNWPLFLGLCLYAIAAIILIISLKYGQLSILYPLISLGFVWVAIIGLNLLGEEIHLLNWLGIASIVLGVTFIGIGGNNG